MSQNNLMHWASIWGNAVSIGENRPESYGKNITLRYPIYSAFDGDAIRLTFDNYCGTDAICIEKTTILIDGSFYPVTFNGKSQAFIPAGESIISDSISCTIQAGFFFKVSFYLKDFTQMRSTVYTSGPLSGGLYATGDQTEVEDIPISISRKTNNNYFLSNVSIHTSTTNRTIVCFGDSITAQDWPDYLALRCRTEGYMNTAIIRRATSGSRILREYDCITYESYGLSGEHRFSHEVPTEGADTVIIQQGINDIIHPVGEEINPFRPMSDLPTAEELIDGLKTYITQARSYGYKVYVGTLLPIEGWRTYATFREDLRNTYNNWIRNTDLIDGVIDFDKALCDPTNPSAFLPQYDSGDHLHPSPAGYERMAQEVTTSILK